MAQIRTRQLLGSDYKTPAPGLYGSLRASQFLKDARNGVNSVDIITIGDSNAGSGGYGNQVGVHRVMSYQYGIDVYATPLLPGGNFLNSSSFSTLGDGLVCTGNQLSTSLDNAVGSTGSTGNLRLMTQYTSDTEVNALVTHLGFNSTNFANDGTTMLPKVNAWQWMPCVIPTGTIWVGTGGNTNATRINDTSPLAYGLTGGGAVNCQYRAVVGTFNASGGQFKLSVFNGTSFGLNTRSAFITTQTSGGGYGYKTETLNFTTQTSATAGVYCSWDGAAQGAAHGCTGPFACLWTSIIQRSKIGYAVSNLIYHGGINGTGLADRLEGMDKVLDMYLKEIRARQIESGGIGRAIIFASFGINSDLSPTPSLAFTNAADRIKARIQQRWIVAGGSIDNLAFIFAPSHPVPAGTVTPWDVNRATVVTNTGAWAITNNNDNSGTCVVDAGIQCTSTKLTKGMAPSGTMYDGGGQSHLNATTTSGSNGYDAFIGAIFNSLMSA